MKSLVLKVYYLLIGFITKLYLRRTRPTIIAVTGSVGKTSCRMIVTQVMRQLLPEKRIYTSSKNFNSEIGLVLSIFQIEQYDAKSSTLVKIFFKILFLLLFPKNRPDILVLEYGIDHPNDMKFLTMISKADIAIFTKLDVVHGEYFASLEAIGDEKFLLMKTSRQKVYLNAFDEYCRTHAEDLKAEVCFYNQGELEVKELRYVASDGNIYSHAEGDFGEVTTNLMGQENMAYILVGIDIAAYLSAGSVHQKEHTFDLDLQPGRFHVFSVGENIFIDSTYNASPESMKVMIENTKTLRDTMVPDYKLGFLLGDMRELGDASQEAHTGLVADLLDADFIFTVGPEMRTYIIGGLLKHNFKGLLKDFSNAKDAGKELKMYLETIGNKSVVLFKGSQNTIFTEEALKELLESEEDKKHLVRQDISWMNKKEVFFSK